MNPQKENTSQLVLQIIDSDLYKQVILQVKKDFELSGQAIDIDEFILPDDLIKEVYNQIHQLLNYNFDAYLQLLYRIDIPEYLMNFTTQNMDTIAQKSTFHILQREWEKVKFRSGFE